MVNFIYILIVIAGISAIAIMLGLLHYVLVYLGVMLAASIVIYFIYKLITDGTIKNAIDFKKLKIGKTSGSHGSANFATKKSLKKIKFLGDKGFILGRVKKQFVRFNQPGHILTLAPTRTGKGVGQVIPNLLEHPGSVVVNDIKGENYAITARYRSTFTKVVNFAPFDDFSACYNPIDFIRLGTEYELDDTELIVKMIIVEQADSKDPFWDRMSQTLVRGFLLHVATAYPLPLRNIAEVRYLLMQDRAGFERTIKEMLLSKNPNVKKIASSLGNTDPKMMSSVLSTAQSHTAVWDSPKLQNITSRSDFALEDIKQKPTSLYIIIPPAYLDVYKPVIRLMVGLTIAAMTRVRGNPKSPVLFLVDEFASLGYMQNIETGMGYLAGYGVTLWLFVQDLSQLKASYPKWETFISNCAARIAFGTNDHETAKTLSDMLGQTTIVVTSTGLGADKAKSSNTSETSRPLMTPDEVMTMPADSQVIFIQGSSPVLSTKIKYFKDTEFEGKFDEWEG